MLYRTIVVAALALAAAQPAHADKISSLDVSGWTGGGYTKNGRFSHCVVSSAYRSGITMFFSVSEDYTWRVAWSHRNWQLTARQRVPISLTVDGVGPYNLEAVAFDSNVAIAELPAKAQLFDLFRKGNRLNVTAQGNNYAFNLDGTYVALTEVLSCVDRHNGRAPRQPAPPPQTATPAPMVPPARPQPSTQSSITAEQRLEATRVVANILAQGDMTGFRILGTKEIAELKSEYFSSSDVVWQAEGIIGTLRILTPSRRTPSEISATIISDDARVCKGRFASGSSPDDKTAEVQRLFTACDHQDVITEARYTVVPLENGTRYLFATVGVVRGEDSRNSRVAKVETILRQAVFEVMKQ